MSVFSSCKTDTANAKLDASVKKSIQLDVETLAADDMEGRETGTPGEMKAALYISKRMKEIGLI